ncbi:MAG: TolC family protein [Armatimonadota bacterium]
MNRRRNRRGRTRPACLVAAAVALAPARAALPAQDPPPTPPAPPAAAQPGTPAPEPQPIAPTAVEPVSLAEAIQIAHQLHANVTVAEENVEAARQRIRQARVGTLPVVIGEIGYSGRGTNNFGGLFGPPPTTTVPGAPGQPPQRVRVDTSDTQFDQGLQPRIGVNYNIFDGGLTRFSVRQARAGLESTAANLEAVRNNLAFDVTVNYLLQLRAERLLELRVEQERLALEQLRSVEANIAADNAAEADRALVLSEYRNRQVDRIAAQNDLRVAANALRNSMGLTVGPPLNLVALREAFDVVPPVEDLREVAVRERPEVVQAEALVRSAQAGVSIARVGRKPRLDTSFSFNLQPNNPLQRADFAVGAVVSLPLFDAGLTHAREQEARTNVQSNVAQLEQVKKDVTAEVQEAYLNLINARERLEAARLAVEAAQVNLEATTARYELGLAGTDVVDLIQAQVQFATANNSAISALYDVHLAQAQLNRALGRL